ncbi:pyridoxamine 5'-phosphate oxidase family protein [Nocardia sp. 348MFTsu5.1]|uniref:pyridoxamine 5'-phosphate oxidase family protein n=1 Tax=Nocardia sp. 348MFTsu5.1 TaxID=1172185 RepID=UPI0003A851BB|nr:pyridoxamine 5'-phosphate oxidase family protein [Nocardia sp. 348MFTsu5.1]
MPRLTTEEVNEFLTEYKVAHIATLAADGSPYVVPASFLFTGSAILITPRAKSVWCKHLDVNPSISLSIDEPSAPHRRVTVSNVKAERLFAPGQEQEWADINRKVIVKELGEEKVDYWIEATSKIPYALYSVPFENPSKSVKTWRPGAEGSDLSGSMAKRYGEIIQPKTTAKASFAEWK